MDTNFDIIIIGAGPGGLSAAIFAVRAGKRVLVIEKNSVGGNMLLAHKIDNYAGMMGVSGYELSQKMHEQAVALGVEFAYDNITEVIPKIQSAIVIGNTEKYIAKFVIIATGSASKSLGLKNEADLTGSGVSYCATCDGRFFKGKDVMVAGSGKTAISDVEYLLPLAKTVYWTYADKRIDDKTNILTADNLIVLKNHAVTELLGNPLNAVKVISDDKQQSQINISGLFVAVGYSPSTFFVKDIINLDAKGYIVTDEHMRTNIKNIYAVGDVRTTNLRQVVTACADGAIAATHIIKETLNKYSS